MQVEDLSQRRRAGEDAIAPLRIPVSQRCVIFDPYTSCAHGSSEWRDTSPFPLTCESVKLALLAFHSSAGAFRLRRTTGLQEAQARHPPCQPAPQRAAPPLLARQTA